MLFDASPDVARGTSDRTSVTELSRLLAGAKHITGPHVLATDGVVAHVTSLGGPESGTMAHSDEVGTEFRLDVTPHVVDDTHVRLELDLELSRKNARATLVADDKQTILLGTGVSDGERHVVLAVRPVIIRGDADLQALLEEKRAAAAVEASSSTRSFPH
ncbi:MAG: hypothetical protein K0S65_1656 [Labilithrix sp.]|nr:hypothetical protein [Labilithrix sp.]